MIDTQRERMRISEMAIRGKLSQRIKAKMSIDDIISEIRAEREILIKNKESKISKTSEMLKEDIFDIPEGWKWVALGDLCLLLSRGKSPKYSEVKKYPVFAQKCNQPKCLALEKALFLDENTLEKWPTFFRLRDADIVINSTGTGTVGRVGYYLTETLNPKYQFMVPDSHVTVVRVGKNIISKYLYYVLRTKTIQNIMEKTYRGSTNQKEFYIDSVYSIPIPLPNTDEQKQIVTILDKAFMQLDIIDSFQQQYAADAEILKSKLIDAAIQGKLTEQLPSDGTAEELYQHIQTEKQALISAGKIKKEKPLKEIEEDEIPFEIPESWKWVRFGDISYIERGGSPRPIKQYLTDDANGINWIKIGDVEKGGKYIFKTKEKIKPEGEKKSRRVYPDDFLLTNSMSFGRPYISKIEGCVHDGWLIIRNLGGVSADYLYYLLSAKFLYEQFCQKASGSTVSNLNIEKVNSAIIPLPPIKEQERIANRIEELLKECN